MDKIRYLALLFAAIACQTSFALAQSLSENEWRQVRSLSANFLIQEARSDEWPFTLNACPDSTREVFAHYYLPFPLSMDNRQASKDRYHNEELNPNGHGGRWRDVGGYIQERPLPAWPWPDRIWRQVNVAIEVGRAARIGLDGFIVDLLGVEDDWRLAGFLSILDTIAATKPAFRAIVEPDMWGIKEESPEALVAVLSRLWRHPATYHLVDGRMLVAPYNAERRPPAYWEKVLQLAEMRRTPIALIPVLVDPSRAPSYAKLSIGLSEWGDRNFGDILPSAKRMNEIATENGLFYMQPVTPQDVRPRERKYFETHGLAFYDTAWRAARSYAKYVQIVTWNDYGETTEASPSSSTRFLFYDITAFYGNWFKCGVYPHINRNAIYVLHRSQLIDRFGSGPFFAGGPQMASDLVSFAAFTRASTTLRIRLCGRTTQIALSAGFNLNEMPACLGKFEISIPATGKGSSSVTGVISKDAEHTFRPIYIGESTQESR